MDVAWGECGFRWRSGLLRAKNLGNIALPMQHAKNTYRAGLNAIKDQIVARWMAAHPGAEILVSLPADIGRTPDKVARFLDRIQQPACGVGAPALLCDVNPDLVQIESSTAGVCDTH